MQRHWWVPHPFSTRWYLTRGWAIIAGICFVLVGYNLHAPYPLKVQTAFDRYAFIATGIFLQWLAARPEARTVRWACLVAVSAATGVRAWSFALAWEQPNQVRIIGGANWTLVWVLSVLVLTITETWATRKPR